MAEWKKDKLGNVIQIKYGKAHSTLSDGEIPCYGSGGLMRYVDKYIYDNASILIPRKGTLNNIMFQNDKFWTVDTMFWSIIDTDKVDPKFLYYQLTLIDYNHLNVGSAVPSLTVPILNDIDISLPPLATQKAIAEVLSSLDDKIDLLHRQNKTLEQIAETLFRQWFVEEAGEDWEEVTSKGVQFKKLSEISTIKIGRTPPRNEFQWFNRSPKDMKWISIKDLGTEGVFVLKTSETLTPEAVVKFNIPIIPKNTVVLSFKMTVGRVAITSEDMLSNEAIAQFALMPESFISKEFLYLFLKSFNYDTLGTTSSIVTAINTALIKDIFIPLPVKHRIDSFNQIVKPIFNKIKFNQIQIGTLTNLRDTILPKLISGEIKIKAKSA